MRSLHLYISPLPESQIPSQIIWGKYIRVGSFCEANRRANDSHKVNLNGSKGGGELNGEMYVVYVCNCEM